MVTAWVGTIIFRNEIAFLGFWKIDEQCHWFLFVCFYAFNGISQTHILCFKKIDSIKFINYHSYRHLLISKSSLNALQVYEDLFYLVISSVITNPFSSLFQPCNHGDSVGKDNLLPTHSCFFRDFSRQCQCILFNNVRPHLIGYLKAHILLFKNYSSN